jgi:hypothetical protein
MRASNLLAVAAACAAMTCTAVAAQPHNVILFIPDGLRARIVDPTTAPTFARLRDEGVNFANSHSLFPTFTTANASAFATGHKLGDTGDFSNYINVDKPVPSSNNTVTPFLETDPVLRDVKAQYAGNYLNEESIVALAAAANYSTALIGKLGPVAIFDLASMDDPAARIGRKGPRTLIVDDSTGNDGGIELSAQWRAAIDRAGLKLKAPGRADNGKAGDFQNPGTHVANVDQQKYFLSLTLDVVLPEFKKANKPFVLVYWSRDPDGTQHNQGDSFGTLDPGINGPTSKAAIRGADDALAAIESKLKALGLYDTTNIVVSADHGFATISKAGGNSAAAALSYNDVKEHELPLGFLAIDLAIGLQKTDPTVRLFDPDKNSAAVRWASREHPSRGNGVIGSDPANPRLIVAANGGSDLIYLPGSSAQSAATAKLARQVVEILLNQDYVSGIFVDESRFGKIPGTLPTESIAIGGGKAVTPHPAIVVNFKSIATGCSEPTLCTAVIADTPLQQGQGMHGSFSRAETWNFMAARGPDFRAPWVDPLPASNADIGMTVAHLLEVNPHRKGTLTGRVLTESLRVNALKKLPAIETKPLVSGLSANGLKTVLNTQSVDGHTYFDAAGFPGRTVGLKID